MIDDILQLVTEIIVIIDGETGATPGTDWSSFPNNQKEKVVTIALDQAFQGAITGKTAGKATPKKIFWQIISNYELDDDYDTFMKANSDWIPGRIPAYENKYQIKFDEKYTGSISQGGPLAIYGYLKKNWLTFAAITIISILAIIFLPKYIKK